VHEPTPEQYNPPLTWRAHVWRSLGVLAISGLVCTSTVPAQLRENVMLLWVDLGLGVVAFVLSFFRRRWPLTVAVLTNAVGALSASSAGAGTLASVSLATRRQVWQIVFVGIVAMAATQTFWIIEPRGDNGPWWVNFAVGMAFTIAILVWGMYIGSRRELLWTLRDRAERAEAEQALRVAQGRSNERARIAREMHDVLAHRISLISMHAGALAYRTDLPPEQVRETAELIQTKAHEALADLRQVLGMLRGEDGVPDRPQPTLPDLATLMDEARTSGMVVDFHDLLPAGRLPSEQVGRTVYRIVQEALTNARKHAAGTHVSVTVSGEPDRGVTVMVGNAKPVGRLNGRSSPGSGLGLVGLRERAALTGGTLTIDETDRAFTLRGWLPWTT
jgi:signal transduction histidine kinase